MTVESGTSVMEECDICNDCINIYYSFLEPKVCKLCLEVKEGSDFVDETCADCQEEYHETFKCGGCNLVKSKHRESSYPNVCDVCFGNECTFCKSFSRTTADSNDIGQCKSCSDNTILRSKLDNTDKNCCMSCGAYDHGLGEKTFYIGEGFFCGQCKKSLDNGQCTSCGKDDIPLDAIGHCTECVAMANEICISCKLNKRHPSTNPYCLNCKEGDYVGRHSE
jgi:hypothetical protein